MKKYKGFILVLLALLPLSFTATSCHDPIFEMISEEVELETNGIRGDVRSIVPFNGYIYCCNNKLYRKKAVSSSESGLYNKQWEKAPSSGISGDSIIFLASDEDNLYALVVDWYENEDDGENQPDKAYIYTTSDGSSWTKIDTGNILRNLDTDDELVIFDNQVQSYESGGTITRTGRKAYLGFYDDSGSYTGTYKLSETSATKVSSTKYCAAAKGSSEDSFTDYYAITANDKFVYWANNKDDIYWGSSTSSESGHKDLNCGLIYSINITNDYLLLGTSSGIKRLKLGSDGVPADSTSSFRSGNNAQSILTERIMRIYVLDNTKDESYTDEYAYMTIFGSISSSSISFDEVGLYAYYPDRNTWNRDGTSNSGSDGN